MATTSLDGQPHIDRDSYNREVAGVYHPPARRWRLPRSVPAQAVQLRLLVDGVALLADAVQLAEHDHVEHAATPQLGERALALRLAPVAAGGHREPVTGRRAERHQADQSGAQQRRAPGQHVLQPTDAEACSCQGRFEPGDYRG